jgi:hypothetical protein
VTNSTRSKLFMLAVNLSAVVAGILGGRWFFDQFS